MSDLNESAAALLKELNESAAALLKEFKGKAYAFGSGILDEAPGKFAAELGKKALFVGPIEEEWFQPSKDRILKSLDTAGAEIWDGELEKIKNM